MTQDWDRAAMRQAERTEVQEAAWAMLWAACVLIVLWTGVVLAFCVTAPRLPR